MFTFSDMKGALGFFGVLLSVLSDGILEDRGVSGGLGCGNKSVNCEPYCEICEYYPPRTECYEALLEATCYSPFVGSMESLNKTEWCNWNNVKRMYNTFTVCTEEIAECLLIPWPNRMVENKFVNIHSRFFPDCPNEALSDPPPSIVFALVMTPICLIPIMVVLVVLKTKNGDGSS
uniref:Receptor (G protein-coupled) activity modifying protein 2 n=1 Tax=Hucho hucho TaxID=62062 RepID=A0A4W5K8Y1_9TELE